MGSGVAQLVERSLPIPEARGLNPVIRKINIEYLFTVNCMEKTKLKKKEAGSGPFFLKKVSQTYSFESNTQGLSDYYIDIIIFSSQSTWE